MPVAAADPMRFAGLWAEWEVDAIARFTHAPYNPAAFRLIRGAKTMQPVMYNNRAGRFSVAAFRQLRASGASLALGYFENYSNAALALSRELEVELRCPVQVNLYITPAGNQALGSHTDPHDVLILQVAGWKTWTIYEGSEATDPHSESVIGPGGWLFLPKGTRHEVRNLGTETSVHLTIGFHPLRWGEVFDTALQRARVAHPAINAPILPGGEDAVSPEAMLERLRHILPFVDVPGQLAKHYLTFAGLRVPVPPGHDVPPAEREAIRADSALRWRGEAVWTVTEGQPSLLMLPYRRAPLKLETEWNAAVETMRARGRFTPGELPIETESAVLLCRLLAGNGMLAIGVAA